ncbi:hypothetical protein YASMINEVIRUS_1366 [Yasminevirus sp. GU-2018]|uniref:Transmembrane protein n=1 Tax=Yasminevirus sp. GU-2018 TaxID=2420051 RepID=A0A5K0UBE4_9VIRU|nr:hypothetical protein YASMINEVIRUS_1366 [Yasminevirus sp. GU-2018]
MFRNAVLFINAVFHCAKHVYSQLNNQEMIQTEYQIDTNIICNTGHELNSHVSQQIQIPDLSGMCPTYCPETCSDICSDMCQTLASTQIVNSVDVNLVNVNLGTDINTGIDVYRTYITIVKAGVAYIYETLLLHGPSMVNIIYLLYYLLEEFVELTVRYSHVLIFFGLFFLLFNRGTTKRVYDASNTYLEYIVLLITELLTRQFSVSNDLTTSQVLLYGTIPYLLYIIKRTIRKIPTNTLEQDLQDMRDGKYLGYIHFAIVICIAILSIYHTLSLTAVVINLFSNVPFALTVQGFFIVSIVALACLFIIAKLVQFLKKITEMSTLSLLSGSLSFIYFIVKVFFIGTQ